MKKAESREPSEVVGAMLREHVGADLGAAEYAAARSRFIDASVRATVRHRRSGRTRAIAVAAALLTVGSVAGWAYVHRSPARLTFAMGATRTPGVVSKYIVPAEGEHLPLYFSDGSVVTLSPAARARVGETTSHGAAVLVESGALTANVVHQATSDWSFVAGPFNVHVTGTAFDLSWDPSGELEIRMTSGAVVVHGPGAENGVEVRDHRRFVSGNRPSVSGSATRDVLGNAAENSLAPAENPLADSRRAHDNFESKTAMHGRESPRAVPAPEASADPIAALPSSSAQDELADDPWSVLVARGEYARVLDIAERHGMEETLGSASVEDLAALADAARLAGRGNLAERALLQLRARFPGTSRALSAAFLLGRMEDDGGNAAAAVSWYERYLGESPNGSLAAEALGRRMMAMRRLNDEESARRAAKDYLERFPNGPHAGIARQMLAR